MSKQALPLSVSAKNSRGFSVFSHAGFGAVFAVVWVIYALPKSLTPSALAATIAGVLIFAVFGAPFFVVLRYLKKDEIKDAMIGD